MRLQADQKLKKKPRRTSTSCSSSKTSSIRSSVHSGKKTKHSSSARRITREEDAAIEFWRLKDDLRNKFGYSQYWSDDVRKSKTARSGDNKRRFQYCIDPSGQEILYLRALQGHSRRNPNDPTLQENVLIPNNFFEYIYHIGCAINLHSITNSGLIPGGQNSSRERQTVFLTAVNPMFKNHKDPQELDLTKPRLALYEQKWKKSTRICCTGLIFNLLNGKD